MSLLRKLSTVSTDRIVRRAQAVRVRFVLAAARIASILPDSRRIRILPAAPGSASRVLLEHSRFVESYLLIVEAGRNRFPESTIQQTWVV